ADRSGVEGFVELFDDGEGERFFGLPSVAVTCYCLIRIARDCCPDRRRGRRRPPNPAPSERRPGEGTHPLLDAVRHARDVRAEVVVSLAHGPARASARLPRLREGAARGLRALPAR